MRQTFDIKEFNYGIISSPDEEDIPQESASDGYNVDGDVGEGILKGIPTDVTYLTNGDTALADVRLGELIEDAGVYYLVYHDSNADVIKAVKNFQSSTVADRRVDTLLSSVTEATMVLNNKEVHVGIGNGSTNYPYWIGKINHKQFGITDYTSIFQGTGLDDLTGSITGYTGSKLVTFDVEIDAAGGTDTFKWRKDGGSYTANVTITGEAQALSDGVTITFAAVTGHTLTDKWHITTEGLYVKQADWTNDGLITISNIAGTVGTGDQYFVTANYYMYAITLIYDGYQESPLYYQNASNPTPDPYEYYTLTLTATNAKVTPATFNRRVTGLNIYRAQYAVTGEVANRGQYRLVAEVPINHAGWGDSSNNKVLTVIDYGTTAKVGADSAKNFGAGTYLENSGLNEDITAPTVNYTLATCGNGYHFVAEAYKSELPDADRYIFRSKKFRFDTFDWLSDFVIMPEKISALSFYEGKLFAFSLNKIFRIDPDNLYIEDVFEGAGAQGQRAVHTTETGMYFGNSLNAWKYSNGNIIPIGDMIRQSASGGRSWQTFTFTTLTDLIVTSDNKKGYVLFINEYLSSGTRYAMAWAYQPLKKRWDCFTFAVYATSANTGIVKGKDGEVYLSNASNTYKLMRNTSTQAWEWVSQELSFGTTRQNKSMTMIKADTGGTVTITYGTDGSTPTTAYTNEALINSYAKTIRVKLVGSTGGNTVDSLEIVYRPLIGAR